MVVLRMQRYDMSCRREFENLPIPTNPEVFPRLRVGLEELLK